MLTEQWRKISRFPGYEVSDRGRVRNRAGKVMKPHVAGKGYLRIIFNGGKRRPTPCEYVHRLVLMAFDREPNEGEEANHLDGVKTNNARPNLEWTTKSGNQLHRARVLKAAVGASHGSAKLTEERVREIRRLRAGRRPPTLQRLADRFGVALATIDLAARGVTWRFA